MYSEAKNLLGELHLHGLKRSQLADMTAFYMIKVMDEQEKENRQTAIAALNCDLELEWKRLNPAMSTLIADVFGLPAGQGRHPLAFEANAVLVEMHCNELKRSHLVDTTALYMIKVMGKQERENRQLAIEALNRDLDLERERSYSRITALVDGVLGLLAGPGRPSRAS